MKNHITYIYLCVYTYVCIYVSYLCMNLHKSRLMYNIDKSIITWNKLLAVDTMEKMWHLQCVWCMLC